MVSPALAVEPAMPPTSAVLVKSKGAQLTLMVVTPVPESPEPSLVVVKWSRSVIGPQLVGESVTSVMYHRVLHSFPTRRSSDLRVWAVLSTTQPVAVVL